MSGFSIEEKALGVKYDSRDRFYTSKWNLLDEDQAELELPNHVSFLDSTLREGGETPWVTLTPDKKIQIAKALEEIGVSKIDCGFVTLSKDHLENLRLIQDEGIELTTWVIVRIETENPKKHIDKAIEAGADEVGIAVYGVPMASIDSQEDYLYLVEDSVSYTKEQGVYCSFFGPFSRWEPSFVEKLYGSAIKGGVDRLDFGGTGNIRPSAFKNLVRRLKNIAGEKQVGVHCHNHMGLATACTVAGVEAGAEVVHTSINGISDEAGLAAFDEVVISLTALYDVNFKLGIKLEKLTELSKMVERITGAKTHAWKPIVGKGVYIETPDSHLERIIVTI